MKFKRKLSYLLMLAIVSFFALGNSSIKTAYGENITTSNIDAVFVLDSSTSMATSDPQGLRNEALNLFVDMCHVKGDKLGLVAYGTSIAKEVPLAPMNSQGDKDNLKQAASNIPLSDATDIGLGLKRAVEVLDSGYEKQNSPLIILLSDGRNNPSRPKAQSEADITNAINTAKAKGYPVYTIGLNADGTVDKDQLSQISSDTGGKSFIISSAKDLPSIFGQIYADRSQLKIISAGEIKLTGDYQKVDVNIPNSNIVEANISIMSQNKVSLELTDNNGKAVTIPSDKVYYSQSNKYSLLKLLSPAQGKWTLMVKGTSGDTADINFIFNYDLHLDVNYTPQSSPKLGDTINVEGYFTSNGQKLQDSDLYKQLTGKLIVKDDKTGQSKEIDLANSGSDFKGQYKFESPGTYEVKVRIDGNSLYRESEVKKYEITDAAPVVTGKIGSLKLKPGATKVLDLGSIFKDPENEKLTYSASINPQNIAEVTAGNGQLIIKPETVGQGIITISAVDTNGGTAKIDVALEVEKPVPVLYVVIGSLGALLAIILGVLVPRTLKKNKRAKRNMLPSEKRAAASKEFTGYLMITVKDESTGEKFPPLFKRLDMFKNEASLGQLIPKAPEYKDTERIKIIPSDLETIKFINNSGCKIEKNTVDIAPRKVCTVKAGDTCNIILNKSSKQILIQYFTKQKEFTEE